MKRVDWRWAVPKGLFVIPVLGALLLAVVSAFKNRISGKEMLDFDPGWVTLFLVATWLVSEAVDVLLNRLVDPVQCAVDRAFDQATSFVCGVKVQLSCEAAHQELERAYETSEETIDIISWQALNSKMTDPHGKKYIDALKKRLGSARPHHLAHRRILWIPEHLDSLGAWTPIWDTEARIQFGYFIPHSGQERPVLPCVIVDERMVNFGWGYLGRSEEDEVNITITQPDAVKAFVGYFNKLWQDCYKLNESPGKRIDEERINKLRALLE